MSVVNSRTGSLKPAEVRPLLSRHMLVDGFELVVDLERSKGSRLYDSLQHRFYIDFFSFFATHPVGFNHPHLWTDAAQKELLHAAMTKVSNADVYSSSMAEFVETFARVAKPAYMKYLFWVEGGALAVENALKAAFDWKVRRNFRKGYGEERGHNVIHFRQAFHGRSGYTLSMTNTYDLRKTAYFPKFNWPRVLNPKLNFPLSESSLEEVKKAEEESVSQIKEAFSRHRDDVAAIIIEPIQGEGGDNHFRKEFLQRLRVLADENDSLLIFDEVQTGVGLTGKMWAAEYFVEPDIIAFGKKTQVCGIMVNDRIDEEPENVFHLPSRINSTWGGNLVDMVRCKLYLEVIESERLLSQVVVNGAYLQDQLTQLQNEFPHLVSNARGRGLFCAVDLPSNEMRNRFRKECFQRGLIILSCGERSLRFRTSLNIDRATLNEGLAIIREVLLSF